MQLLARLQFLLIAFISQPAFSHLSGIYFHLHNNIVCTNVFSSWVDFWFTLSHTFRLRLPATTCAYLRLPAPTCLTLALNLLSSALTSRSVRLESLSDSTSIVLSRHCSSELQTDREVRVRRSTGIGGC